MSGTNSLSEPPRLSTGAAVGAMGVGGAVVIVLGWVLSFWHIPVPDQVSTALTVLFSAGTHQIASWHVGRSFRAAAAAATASPRP